MKTQIEILRDSVDFSDASTPRDVVTILRNTAETFADSQVELDGAWQGTNGDAWSWLSRRFESFANQLEREIPKHL